MIFCGLHFPVLHFERRLAWLAQIVSNWRRVRDRRQYDCCSALATLSRHFAPSDDLTPPSSVVIIATRPCPLRLSDNGVQRYFYGWSIAVTHRLHLGFARERHVCTILQRKVTIWSALTEFSHVSLVVLECRTYDREVTGSSLMHPLHCRVRPEQAAPHAHACLTLTACSV